MPAFFSFYGSKNVAGTATNTLTGVTMVAGHTAVIFIQTGGAGGPFTINTIVDSLGNTWTSIPGTITNRGTISTSMWYCQITTGGSGVTITVTASASVANFTIAAAEFSGCTGVVDTSSGNNNAASNPSIGITISNQNDLIVAGLAIANSGGMSVASPFVNVTSGAIQTFDWMAYCLPGTSTGTFTFTLTGSTSQAWEGSIVALLGAPDPTAVYSVDAYMSPVIWSKTYNVDAFVTVPQSSWSVDAYVTGPAQYVRILGNILFKINNPNGFVNLKGTINQRLIVGVSVLGTIISKNTLSSVNLAATIQVKPTPSYVRLIATINNPTFRGWKVDAVVSSGVLTPSYVQIAGTIVQKIQPGPVPTGAYPDSSYTRIRATIHNPPAGIPSLGVPPNDSIQMPGSGFTTSDDWYSSIDAGASYKPGSVFTIFGPGLPTTGINIVVTAFTTGVMSFQTRTRSWLRRVDAAASGIVVNTQTQKHTLPNGAVITTTTVTTQNQDSTTTAITIQNSATPTRTSTIITEKQIGGQTSEREIDTTTINGIVTNVEKKTVYSTPPLVDNPQPLKVTTLDGIQHYQFFGGNNAEWAGGDLEGVSKTLTQEQIIPGTINGQSQDQFGNPILQKITTTSVTTPDGKVISTTTSEVGSSTAKDFGTTTIDTVNTFAGLQKTESIRTTYPDGSVVTKVVNTNALTGESTETDTETVIDEFGQITTTVTTVNTKVFTDPVSGIQRQVVTKTVNVTKGGVTTTDTTVVTNNDFEDSIVNQKIKVYFIQEFTITCVIDELNMFALYDLNTTLQKNYTLLELFGQQLGNASLSWPLRNKLINQFNLANSSITPFQLQALGKVYNVVFAQSASAFRAKYIPGVEPHVYELQMILQTRSDIISGTFGF